MCGEGGRGGGGAIRAHSADPDQLVSSEAN